MEYHAVERNLFKRHRQAVVGVKSSGQFFTPSWPRRGVLWSSSLPAQSPNRDRAGPPFARLVFSARFDRLQINRKGVTCVLSKRSHEGDAGTLPQRVDAISDREKRETQLETSLTALYSLLETYSPQWYTRAHKERAELALKDGPQPLADVFIELHDLLEAYAPSWYTPEQHKRAEAVMQWLKSVKRSAPKAKLARRAGRS